MGIRGPKYIITPNDWQQVQIDLNDLYDRLTSAINTVTGGIVTDHNSLSGLQGGSAGQYYHLTAAEHAALSGYISTESDPVFTAWLATVTPANWDTAYSERLEWDGGSTNLVAATGRTSLGLGTAATHAATDFQAAGSTYLTGSLTSGRIPVASGAQTLADVSTLTWVSPTLFTPQIQTTGTVAFNGSSVSATTGINGFFTTSSQNASGALLGVTVTKNTHPGGLNYGISFVGNYTPTYSAGTGNRTMSGLWGGLCQIGLTLDASELHNYTLTAGYGYDSQLVVVGTAAGGNATITTHYMFRALTAIKTGATASIGTLYGFYDAGQTAATNNWGIGINTANNYINGSLSIGKNTAPAVALDVVGQITANNIVTGTFFQTSTAITANSTGTVVIAAKDANLLTTNAGWMPIKKSDGTTVYMPYWA